MLGNLCDILKMKGIITDRLFAENLDPGPRSQGSGGLIETYMPVRADSQYLEIDSTGIMNTTFIFPSIPA